MADYLIGGALLVVAGLIVWWGIYMLQKRKRVLTEWIDTEATVLELLNTYTSTRRDDNGFTEESYTYEYKISYMANGTNIENKIKGDKQYNIGDTFAIKFNPSDPNKYEVTDDIVGFVSGAVILFIMAAGVGYYGITWFLK